MEKTYKKRANNLKALRIKAGLTQTELAARSGIGQNKISLYEMTDDLSKIYFGTIIRIAEALGVMIDEIVTPISAENPTDR